MSEPTATTSELARLSARIADHFHVAFGRTPLAERVQDILAQRFPAQAGDDAQVVFHSSAPLNSPTAAASVFPLESEALAMEKNIICKSVCRPS